MTANQLMQEKHDQKRINVVPKQDFHYLILLPQTPNSHHEISCQQETKQPQKTPFTRVCVLFFRHRPKCPPNELYCSTDSVTCSSNRFLILVKSSQRSSMMYDCRCVFDRELLNSNRSCCRRRSTIVCDDCDGGLVSAHSQKRSLC